MGLWLLSKSAFSIDAAALALTIGTSAIAREHQRGQSHPGYGYTVSDRNFPIWDYAAYRYLSSEVSMLHSLLTATEQETPPRPDALSKSRHVQEHVCR